jgi:hypothetical protein
MSDLPSDPTIEQVSIPAAEEPKRSAVPAWLISGVAHGVVLGMFSLMVVAMEPEKVDDVAVSQTMLPPKPVDPAPLPSTLKPPVDAPLIPIPAEDTVEAPVTPLETVDQVTEMQADDPDNVPPGQTEAVSNVEMGAQGAFIAIGPGSGDAGLHGMGGRGGRERKQRFGSGVPGRESAIDRALRWFSRHQSPNGQWDVDGYQANCLAAGPKCEPGTGYTGADGDLACTSYALLCYLGAGYDHRMPSRHKLTVQRGLDWLVAQQGADGLWGSRNYEHAITTMALAEAYAMSNDPRLRAPVEKGIAIIRSRQAKGHDSYGLGWDYVAPNAARNDASVSGWNVMALKSAKAAGLDVGDSLEGANRYLEAAWKAANPTLDLTRIDPYKTESVFPYTWNAETGAVDVKPGADSHDMSCVGAVCSVFLRKDANDPMLITLANHIEKTQKPTAYPTNTYYLYYNSMAMFQLGMDRFGPWSKQVDNILCQAQRQGDECFTGSWDWEGTKFHGSNIGRLLSTAYCTLALEVIYRANPVLEAKKH